MRVESQCEAIIQRVLATFRGFIVSRDEAALPGQVDLLLWTVRAVCMRPNLKVTLALGDGSADLASSLHNNGASGANTDMSVPATWQEYLLQSLVTLITTTPVSTGSQEDHHHREAFGSALQLRLASSLQMLTTDVDFVLSSSVRATAAVSVIFWKQKLWSRTFGPLSHISSRGTGTGGTNHGTVSQLPVVTLLSICSLVAGMPINILQDSLADLVSIVVMAVSRAQTSSSASQVSSTSSEGGAHRSDTSSGVLAQQSLRTLEKLLSHDAQLFVPYLNIIVPALMEVSGVFIVYIFFIGSFEFSMYHNPVFFLSPLPYHINRHRSRQLRQDCAPPLWRRC